MRESESGSGRGGRWRGVTDLVAEALGGDDGDLVADPLVRFEVERQFGVVALDDDFGRLLDRLLRVFVSDECRVSWLMAYLCANATHLCGWCGWLMFLSSSCSFRDCYKLASVCPTLDE